MHTDTVGNPALRTYVCAVLTADYCLRRFCGRERSSLSLAVRPGSSSSSGCGPISLASGDTSRILPLSLPFPLPHMSSHRGSTGSRRALVNVCSKKLKPTATNDRLGRCRTYQGDRCSKTRSRGHLPTPTMAQRGLGRGPNLRLLSLKTFQKKPDRSRNKKSL